MSFPLLLERWRSAPAIVRNVLLAAIAFLVLDQLMGRIPDTLLDLQFAAGLAVVYCLAILSIVVLTGYVGQVSLCQATFMGLGSYGTAWAFSTFHVNYLLAMLIGVSLAFALGVIVGLPALRLQGILLAIVTLGVALVFDRYFFQDIAFGWFTGGSSGWAIDNVNIFNTTYGQFFLRSDFRIALIAFLVVAVLVVNIAASGSGRRFRAIRDSELAAATMGVDLVRYKLIAFGISAAIAGLGGALYPLLAGRVSAQPFWVFTSLQFAAFAVLMGIRYVPAAALGGFFMAFVPPLLDHYDGWAKTLPGLRNVQWATELNNTHFQVVLGTLLVVQLILLPDGVWGDLRHNFDRIKHRFATHPAPVTEAEAAA